MMGLFAPTHLIIVLIVALVVFRPKRLPEIGRSLGQGLRELKKAWGDNRFVEPGRSGAGACAGKGDGLDHVDSKHSDCPY